MPGDSSSFALRGRIGAYRLHATHDPRETTAAARAAFLGRFLAEIDPDLPEPERLRRAASARKAYFAQLAYRSAVARAKKAAPNANGTASKESRRASVADHPAAA